MMGLINFMDLKKGFRILAVMLTLYVPFMAQVQAADVVTTYKDENGWKLQVNGEDFYVKGVVWTYTPRNENFNYNLFGQSDEFIKKVLDYEFGLMKKAGINSIRTFTDIPPEWITYIYKEHGIMSVVNPLMGRYGYEIGGKWVPRIDYSDELTRATLKRDMLEIVQKYKNTPGVLMFAFGNESNYGLEWSSAEIENLPVGEQHREKAKYLYSLWNEVIAAGKRVDPNHPFAIVNGDIQYLDLIAEYTTDMDILGTNVYRGKSFGDMWKDVKEKFDRPIVFMEFGSDAFNARENREDQVAQATFLKHQWLEMYNKSYGNGEEGNAIGGYVFEWRDEWWKYNVEDQEDLDVHDNNASWANGGYTFDYVEGKNNMNEEWFGITRLGTPNADGVYEAIPRMAYDVLTEIWKIDPYLYKKVAINQEIKDINMEYQELKADVRMMKADKEHGYDRTDRKRPLSFAGGSLNAEFALKGNETDIDEDGEEGVEFTDGEWAFLDFEFQPTEKIEGRFSLNVFANAGDYGLHLIQYGRELNEDDPDRDRLEIYDFEGTYTGGLFDLNTFYHTPRYHWKYEGDFFGLLRETTDIEGQDIWNAKAPFGAEIVGKDTYDGLKVVFGPEVYWGANPLVMVKYSNKIGNIDYTLMHSEDVARLDESATATEATETQTRQSTAYIKTNITENTKLEVGGIMASTDKVDEEYTRRKGNTTYEDEIEFEDTLGARVQLTHKPDNLRAGNLYFSQMYMAAHYAGLVADVGDQLKEFGDEGTHLPYSELGNKAEFEAGLMMNYGDLMIYPRILYRDNLEDANRNIDPDPVSGDPGLTVRNREDDPFAVLDNREARSAEIFFTYDPTGSTPFYAWDNDQREDAPLAFNIGLNYTEFPTDTDSYQFFDDEFTNSNAAFGEGLGENNVWKASSRIVANPSRNLKMILRLLAANQQPDGNPFLGGARTFYEADAKFIIDRKHILSGYFKKDAWGAYDFQEQFNFTYPEQYRLDYSLLLDKRMNEDTSSKIGVKALFRTLDDEDSIDADGEFGLHDWEFLTIFYFKWAFE